MTRLELQLPGWLSDLDVTVGRAPSALAEPRDSGVLWQSADSSFLIRVPGVARYLVRDGRSVVVDPEPGSSHHDVERILFATPLAALCYQRALSVLHAAAATRDGQTVLIAGVSSVGKSTLLAELLVRGWRMVADDLTPIGLDERGRPIVLPSRSELVLWPDVPDRLAAAPALARRAFESEPTRLETIWWLSVDDLRRECTVERLSATESFGALGALAYNRRIADSILDPAHRLRIDAPIAGTAIVQRVRRARGCWTVIELADLVEAASSV